MKFVNVSSMSVRMCANLIDQEERADTTTITKNIFKKK